MRPDTGGTRGRGVEAEQPAVREETAFTLIELLVVIAIIAILAAILFPVFAKARDRAKVTTCLNNQKQLALAIHTYADDYDGLMPFGIQFADGIGRPWIRDDSGAYRDGYRQRQYSLLYRYLEPYVKSDGIFQCVADFSERKNSVPKRDEVSYRVNPYGTGYWKQDGTAVTGPGDPDKRPLSFSQCRRPSEFVLFRERFTDYHWKLSAQEEANGTNYAKRRAPVAMVDGSVKMIPGVAPPGEPEWRGFARSFYWTGHEPADSTLH
jgi:prepilin-type N-terminal cleavage/methylation domain-containing protein